MTSQAQLSNLLQLINVGTSNNSGNGDPLRVCFQKDNSNALALAGAISTNFVFTGNTTLAYGAQPTVTLNGVTNNVAWFSIGVPQGPPATNAVYPTATFTLLDTNPIVFSGSNYLGLFTNVYKYTLNVPEVGAGGLNLTGTSNEVENLYYSQDNMNWFQVTNNPCLLTNMTGVYLSVSGQSGTNAGEVILTGVQNPAYIGANVDLSAEIVHVADGGVTNLAVNFETVQAMIYNATANGWSAQGGGIAYAPYGSNVCQLVSSTLTFSRGLTFISSGTNWQLSLQTTNLPLGGVLVESTNLTLSGGGFQAFTGGYSVATNAGVVTFTIPKANVAGSYGFFQVGTIAFDGMMIWPWLALQSGIAFATNTIATASSSTFGFGAGLMTCDTNYLYLSVGTNAWRRIAIPTNTW